MSTTYIKATLVFKIPVERLTTEERRDCRKQFNELQTEVTQTCPDGVIATLTMEEVTE